MTETTNYVLGFAFDVDTDRVCLIGKKRPAWQAGKLNGIGGRIEPGELPRDAMVREFEEEAGMYVPADQWREYAVMRGSGFCVHVFAARGVYIDLCTTQTDEQIYKVSERLLPWDFVSVSNLRWLIAMAHDADAFAHPLHIRYRDIEVAHG